MSQLAQGPSSDPVTAWLATLRQILAKPRRTTDDWDIGMRPEDRRGEALSAGRLPPRRDDTDVGTQAGEERSGQLWRSAAAEQRQLEVALERLRNRFVVDRTATIDQLTGRTFAEVRSDQLAEYPGATHLSQEYGLKAAGIKLAEGERATGIRTQSKLTTGYMREALPFVGSPFKALYKQATGKEATASVQFLNSPIALRKMRLLAPPGLVLPGDDALIPLPKDGPPVCWAVVVDAGADGFEGLSHTVGATPSTQAAMQSLAQNLAGPSAQPAAVSATAKNDERVAGMKAAFANPQGGPYRTLHDLPAGHPAKATAASVENLLAGLGIAPGQAKDPLIENALANLHKLVKGMAACSGDATRLSQLYELFVEEIHLVLARTRPHTEASYQQAVTASLQQRAPSLAGLSKAVQIKPFLMASGMDALSTAVVGALERHGGKEHAGIERTEGDKSYFEVAGLLEHSGVKTAGAVIVATLNASTPVHGGPKLDEPSGLIDTVCKKLAAAQPTDELTLILDVTIEEGAENGTTDLESVFAATEIKKAIESGQLRVVLCKSYQKYSTMGSGKIMAGNLTLIGRPLPGDPCQRLVDDAHAAHDPFQDDEAQLMTHLVANGGKDETALLAHAAANAELVHGQCWPPPARGLGFEAGLPFLMAPKTVRVAGGEHDTMNLLAKMGLDHRESFGFQQSSCLEAGETIRINTGQESEVGAIEKLYAVGLLMQGQGDEQALASSIDDDLAVATSSSSGRGNPDRLVAAKAASKLLLMARVVAPADATKKRVLQSQLQRLLDADRDNKGERVARLTPEMRTRLTRECLRLSLASEAVDLGARHQALGVTLRTAYEQTGAKGGWDSVGGRAILVALGKFEQAASVETAAALADECSRWLTQHPGDHPGRREVEDMLRDARHERDRRQPATVAKSLLAAMPYAEDVARFLTEDAPDALFGTADATSPEGQAVLDACLSRLDVRSRIAVLGKLGNASARGAACKRKLESALAAPRPSSMAPETLADSAAERDGAAAAMSAADLDRARLDYLATQCRSWSELESWLAKPTFELTGLPQLQRIAATIKSLAKQIVAAGDEPAQASQLQRLRAGLANSFNAAIGKMVADQVQMLVQTEQRRIEVQARQEAEARHQEMVRAKVAEFASLGLDALIAKAGPSAAEIGDMVQAFETALGQARRNAAALQRNEWEDLRLAEGRITGKATAVALPGPEGEALRELLERAVAKYFANVQQDIDELEPKAATEPPWLVTLRGRIDSLPSMRKVKWTSEISQLSHSPDEAGKVRERMRKDRSDDVKAIGNEDGCWP